MADVEDIIKKAALQAGKAVAASAPSKGAIEKEGRVNWVTAADLTSEKIIIDLITENFPDHDILSEETDSNIQDPLQCKNLWIIDPIDGTNNFLHERGYSATSIGYAEKGVLKAAAVYDPFRDQLFTAVRGEGAFMNGQPIKTGSLEEMAKATVATDNSYYAEGTRHNLELMMKVEPTPWYMMRGSAVLGICDAAAGRVDLYFHTFLKPWDNAAAFLIAQEAGATVLGLDGKEIDFLSDSAVIGNAVLVRQFTDAVN